MKDKEKHLNISASTSRGEVDEYTIADSETAQSILDAICQDIRSNEAYSSGLCFRAYWTDRTKELLEIGSDRDDNSQHWHTDRNIPAGNKTFFEVEKRGMQDTLTRLLVWYRDHHREISIVVYEKNIFDINLEQLFGVFREPSPKKRLEGIVGVYHVHLS